MHGAQASTFIRPRRAVNNQRVHGQAPPAQPALQGIQPSLVQQGLPAATHERSAWLNTNPQGAILCAVALLATSVSMDGQPAGASRASAFQLHHEPTSATLHDRVFYLLPSAGAILCAVALLATSLSMGGQPSRRFKGIRPSQAPPDPIGYEVTRSRINQLTDTLKANPEDQKVRHWHQVLRSCAGFTGIHQSLSGCMPLSHLWQRVQKLHQPADGHAEG